MRKHPATRHQRSTNLQYPIGTWLLGFLWCFPLAAQDKVTYQDHILPLVETHCSKCHNPDKLKGDLDLTSFNGTIKGGGSGQVVISGNPDSSKLWKAIMHAEEPTMPPNKKLADKELDVFKKWIAGGLLENSGSKAIVSSKPAMDLTVKAGAGKPEGPIPMPSELALDPVVHTKHGNPLIGLAASPWSPLVAIAGQKQVLLFNTDTLDFLGVLPFTNGQPVDLKFSRNAKLLLAGGGHGAKSGKVVVWDVASGEQVMVVGEEQDTVTAADISPDQAKIAIGGPSRFVKIYSTSDGEVLHKIKKHTDWVTAVAFSPNGEFLASGDRNGGISLWDPENGQELFTLPGHRAAVTSLSWRDDSKILASASEDGNIRWWETAEGKQAKTWAAHSGGVLSVAYTHDGKLISCGRDNQITSWNAEGNKAKSFQFQGELPLRTAFSHDGERVVATDFAGRVAVWNAKDAKRLGDLEGNPLPLADRLARSEKRLSELQAQAKQPNSELTKAETAFTKAKTDLETANKTAETAKTEQKANEDLVVKLKEEAAKVQPQLLTQVFPPPEHEKKLADARAARAKARDATTNALSAIEARKKDLDTSETNLAEAKAKDPAKLVPAAKAEVAKWKAALAQTDLFRARQSLSTLRRELEAYNALVAEKKSVLEKAADAEKSTLESDLKTAEAAVKKLSAQLSSQEAKVKKLAADLQQIKPTQLSSR